MNQKDINKCKLFIDRAAKKVVIARAELDGSMGNLQVDSTTEFLRAMLHYLTVKSDGGIKPVNILVNGQPSVSITITAVGQEQSGTIIKMPD